MPSDTDLIAPAREWFRLHVAALGLMLVGVGFGIDADHIIAPDEGLYSLQAAYLAEGRWSGPRPAPTIDLNGSADAMGPEIIAGSAHVPYIRHPLYPILLTPFFVIAGMSGLLFTSIIATLLAALAASSIARRVDERYAVPALWLTGIGTPLFFDAFLVMGHAAAAAAVGGATACAFRFLDNRRRPELAAALGCAALAVLLRTEGALAVAALAGSIGVVGLTGKGPQRKSLLVVSGGIGVAGGLAVIGDYVWSRSIGAGYQTVAAGVFSDRKPDLVSTLKSSLTGWWNPSSRAETVSLLAIGGALTLAALSLRLLPRFRVLPLALVLVAAIAAIWRSTQPPSLIKPLLVAMPFTIGALILVPSFLASTNRQILALASLSSIAAIGATAYGIGGAVEWGGRFFHLVIPLVTPLIIDGLAAGRRRLDHSEAQFATIALIIVAVTTSVVAVRSHHTLRSLHRELHELARSVEAQLPSDNHVLIWAPVRPNGTSRGFWRELTEGTEVLAAGNLGHLNSLASRAVDQGTSVIILTDTDPAFIEAFLDHAATEFEQPRPGPFTALIITTTESSRPNPGEG